MQILNSQKEKHKSRKLYLDNKTLTEPTKGFRRPFIDSQGFYIPPYPGYYTSTIINNLLQTNKATFDELKEIIEAFEIVSKGIYRGAYPDLKDENGFQLIAKFGIKTIIDLREERGIATHAHQLKKLSIIFPLNQL